MSELSQQEKENCLRIFLNLDIKKTGYIIDNNIEDLFRELELFSSESEFKSIMILVKANVQYGNRIDFPTTLDLLQEFTRVRKLRREQKDDPDIVSAFEALGGGRDLQGLVMVASIRQVVVDVFEMDIKLDLILRDLGLDEEVETLPWTDFCRFMNCLSKENKSMISTAISLRPYFGASQHHTPQADMKVTTKFDYITTKYVENKLQ